MAEDSKYETHVRTRMTEIVHWIRLGVPERQICERIDIGYTAWCTYKHTYPEFKQILAEARKQSSHRVETALYKRATGYEYTEMTTTTSDQGDSTKVVTKHMPPDVIACIFWLKNREKMFWKDKHEVDQTIQTPQSLADVVRNRKERTLEGKN